MNCSPICRQRAEELLYNLQMWRFIFCIFASKLDWGYSTSATTPIPIVRICHGLCRLTSLSLVLAFKLLFSSPSSCLIILSFFLIGSDIFLTSPSYPLQRCFHNKNKKIKINDDMNVTASKTCNYCFPFPPITLITDNSLTWTWKQCASETRTDLDRESENLFKIC